MNRGMVERLRGSAPPPLVADTYELRVVRTTGRSSGQDRPVPLAVVHHEDRRYLVAPDAHRDWVANIEARPRGAIEAGGAAEGVVFARVAGPTAARVAAAYAAAAPGPARAAFPFGDGAGLDEVEAVLDRMAIFEVRAGSGSDGG
jgi:deazaflavin-dependent oxidoreductase (nitroreductase family)